MNVAILLSNLLDNAMEAAEKAELRKVQLEMYEEKGMYYIDIINTVNASVLHHNPKLQSTKKDKTTARNWIEERSTYCKAA